MNESQQQLGNKARQENKQPVKRRLRRTTGSKFFDSCKNEPEEKKIKWLVDGIVSANGNTIFAADQKFGKSLISISLALSVASGKPFLGEYKVLKTGPVYIHCPEGTRQELMDRMEGILTVMELRIEDLPLVISEEYDFYLDNEQDQACIEEQLLEEGFVLQIFDPLNDCFEGSLQSPLQVKKMGRFLKRISREYGVTNFVPHHKNKAKNADHTKEVQGDGGVTAYADDIWTGSKHGDYDRKIMFEQRGRPAQEPLCFRLPQSVNDPIKLEIISEKVLGSKKAPLLLRVVKKAREDREENGTDTWTVDFLRETLKGSNNLYKPVTSKLLEIKFFSKKQRGLAVGENWDCPDEVLEIAARELVDGKTQSSVRLSKSDGPPDGKADEQGKSSAETSTPSHPSTKRRTGTNKTLSLGGKIKSFFKGEQK